MLKVFYWILLGLDAVVYNFINYAYQIFLLLTRVVIANEELISPFIKRIYTVIGVVMLFILAYSFLKAIVNPENNGAKSMGKIVFDVVKAIILLALVPSIFDFAYTLQDSLLNQNTIGRLILGAGDGNNSPADTISQGGLNLSRTMLQAFIFPKDNETEYSSIVLEGDEGYTLQQIWDSISSSKTFRYITLISDELALDENSEVDYSWLISTFAACYILYLLISYCLSLGLRVIKLLFYELMAPIPILLSILPNKKDMFNKWLSITLTTYIEVFLRIGIMYLTVYIASLIPQIDFATLTHQNVTNGMIKSLAVACVVMGLFTFVKKAPELIAEITGIDSSKMSSGIKEQLKTGGGLLAASALGGAATSMVRNAANAKNRVNGAKAKWKEANKKYKNGEITENERNKARNAALRSGVGAAIGGVGSTIAGTISGGIRSAKAGKDADSFADIKSAATKGSEDAVRAREKRANYKASHGGTVGGALLGHIKDVRKSAKNWAEDSNIESLERKSSQMGELADSYIALNDGIEGLLEKEQSKGKNSVFLNNGFGANEVNLYNEYDKAKQAYDQAQAEFNSGKLSSADLATAKGKMVKARDQVTERLMNMSLEGSEGTGYKGLSTKAQAAMKDSLVNAEKLKAKVIENANSEVVQSFDKLVKNINDNKVTTKDFETTDGEKLKDKARTAQGYYDIKIAEMNKEKASKGDSK